MPVTIKHKSLVLFFCYLLIVAMIFSPVLLSVTMIVLCGLSVFKFEIYESKIIIAPHRDGIERIKKIAQSPSFAVLLIFFVITLLRFSPIGDLEYFLVRVRIKLPFLFLPFAFLGLPRLSEKNLRDLLYFMLVFFSIVSIGILVNYFMNLETLTEHIKKGRHIPTPRNHIRYSLLAAWGCIGGIYLYIKQHRLKYEKEHWLIGTMIVFLFFFLHLLSVKSGLLILYACLGLGLLQFIWIKQRILLGLIGFLGLLSIPIIAYYTIPTFHNKVLYFQHDMYMYKKGTGDNYSDSGRIASIEAGWHITKDNWLLGVGTANIRNEVRTFFKKNYPNYPEAFMPQNQFLFTWASTGIFGFLAIIFSFFMPLFYQKNYRHPLFLNFYFSIFIIITIEQALENAVGVAHYLFFLLFFLNLLNNDSEKKTVQPPTEVDGVTRIN